MIVEGIFQEGERVMTVDATAYINLLDLLLKLAELSQEASKKEILAVIYEMPTRRITE